MTTFNLRDKSFIKTALNNDVNKYKGLLENLETELYHLNKKIQATPEEIDSEMVDGVQRLFIRKGTKNDVERLKQLNEEMLIVKKVIMSLESITMYEKLMKR